jgi:acetyl/propionyl-CoA carboxylase alpha subunit
MPAGPGVRVDAGVAAGDLVPSEYDNLVAKLMVHGGDRDAAIDRLRRALDEVDVAGIQTSLPFHRAVARHAGFRTGQLSTTWVADEWDGPGEAARRAKAAQVAAALVASHQGQDATPAMRHDARGHDGAGMASWRRSGLVEASDRWPR